MVQPVLAQANLELSVVIPCLNEADTLAGCIESAFQGLAAAGCAGEVIVADNGSSDGSQEIATRLGARVVSVSARGYGNALMGGIEAARGQFILMGDADASYDFKEIPAFIGALRQGFELVQGCRLPSGGGTVLPKAMPFLHRWLGNPLLTFIARLLFQVPIHDIYCGMRGFSRSFYQRLEMRCTGMEFATEMIVKGTLRKANISEVPITLHPDGRIAHPPHLRTFRDGWRTLRFFLLFSPRWLFLYPAILCLGFGGAIGLAGLLQLHIGKVTFDLSSQIVGSLVVTLGLQIFFFALAARCIAVKEGILPVRPRLNQFFRVATLERGIVLGLVCAAAGLCLIGWVTVDWWASDFGRLDYAHSVRKTVLGTLLATVGTQTIFSSFFISILGIERK